LFRLGSWPRTSIVAVHGLGGDAFDTWTEDGKLWLRDFLPQRLPKARIYTYGYDSIVAFSKSSAEVDDYARDLLNRVKTERAAAGTSTRPLYFICHSLGGIVVKQALNVAHQSASIYESIRVNVAGIAFMGTPHAGADIAAWGAIAAKLLGVVSLGTRTNQNLLPVLQTESAFLSSLSDVFALRNWELPILSFYELDKLPLLNCKVSASRLC
jgi:triacylglycerol esterase/lipase EstA (alpha/beta hydrolase family)